MPFLVEPKMYLGPKGAKGTRGIISDMEQHQDYIVKYLQGIMPDEGDIPRNINIVYKYFPGIMDIIYKDKLPEVIGYGQYIMCTKEVLDIINNYNGPKWQIKGYEINLVTKNGKKFPYVFICDPPRAHMYNHDRITYPYGKIPYEYEEGAQWIEYLGDVSRYHPNTGLSIRPLDSSDPQYWEDPGVVINKVLWEGGGIRSKYMSNDL